MSLNHSENGGILKILRTSLFLANYKLIAFLVSYYFLLKNVTISDNLGWLSSDIWRIYEISLFTENIGNDDSSNSNKHEDYIFGYNLIY